MKAIATFFFCGFMAIINGIACAYVQSLERKEIWGRE